MTGLRARLAGLAALIGLLAVVIGIPVLLLAIGAGPIPDHTPTIDGIRTALTSPDDGTALLVLLRVLAWAAWAFITLSVALEIASRARGIPAPHLPGLGLPQNAARGLVGAVVLLFAAGPLAAQAAPAQAATSYTAPAAPATASTTASPSASTVHQTPATARATSTGATAESGRHAHPTHTVRSGDTLWSLADRYLGDGNRYGEIADLNYGVRQPDGGALTSSHWLRPGWRLQLPTSTERADEDQLTYTVRRGDTLWDVAEEHLGDGERYPEIYEVSRQVDQPDGSRLTDPDEIHPGQVLRLPAPKPSRRQPQDSPAEQSATPEGPATSSPASPAQVTPSPAVPSPSAPTAAAPTAAESTAAAPTAAAQPSRPAAVPAAPAQRAQPPATAPSTTAPTAAPTAQSAASTDTAVDQADDAFPVRTLGGVGAVLAAGVLTLVGTRRRRQQRRRQPGQPLVMPDPAAAATEQQLRATADPFSVTTVDTALRSLAAHHARTQTPLPVVRAARLTTEQLELYLAEPADLPTPWTGTNAATVWVLHATHTSALDQVDLSDVPAPYPALVTIGHDLEAGHVFVDLEYLGALAITGDDPTRNRETATALAIELATSSWADDLQVTIVGAHPELEDTLQSGRIRYLPSAGRILDELEARAALDRQALAGDHAPDLQHARISGAAPDAWTPEIVIFAGAITPRQRMHLSHLVHADTRPRVAIAAITCDIAVGEWTLDLTPGEDLAVLQPTDLQLRPQRIDPTTYGHLLELLALTDTDTTPEVDDVDPEPDLDTLAHVHPGPEPTAPAVSAPPVDLTSSPAPVIRVLGRVELTGASGSVEPSKQARLLEYAAYLALNPGATHTAIDEAIWPGRPAETNYNTRNTATSKLRSWLGRSLDGEDWLPRHQGGGYALHQAVHTDWGVWTNLLPNGPLKAPTEALQQALSLVRGRPFDGVHPRRYAWAEPIRQRMIAEIVDASYELARRALMEGRWRAAETAVVTGLSIEPGLERLWRLRILAAHEARDTAAEQEAIDRMLAITEQLGGDLETRTQNLLDALDGGTTVTLTDAL